MQQTTSLLIVDEEPDHLEALQALLAHELPHVHVETVRNAQDAMKALHGEGFNAVLTNHRPPYTDGMRLLKDIRLRHPNVARGIMTAGASAQLAMAALNEAGVRLFLSKPFEPAGLAQHLDGFLDPGA